MFRQVENAVDPNIGEVWRDEFNDLTGIFNTKETGGTVTIQDPIGTAVLPQKALTIECVSAGTWAEVDLGVAYNEIYVQYYVSIINDGGTSGYEQQVFVSGGAGASQNSFSVLTNHSVGNHRYYIDPTFAYFGMRQKVGQWTKIGLHIDRIGSTVTRYHDGEMIGTSAITSNDIRYLLFGGGVLPNGYKLQIASLTANTNNFSAGVPNVDGIGEVSKIYVDASMDSGIDASGFSGLHKEPFDPDGGTNYIDGALRYSKALDTEYFKLNGEVLYKKGVKHKLLDLNTSNGVKIIGDPTTEILNYTLKGYGDSVEKPYLYNSIEYNGTWTVEDAPNNVYRSNAITGIARLSGVWFNENLGLRESVDILDFGTYSGIYFIDGTDVLVKLWDGTDPSLGQIDLISNIGFLINNYCNVKGLHFKMGGITTSDYSTLEYNDFSTNAGSTIGNFGKFRYNKAYDNWSGGQYVDATLGGKGEPFTANTNSLFYGNEIADSYIGIQINYGQKNVMVAFNIVKNIIVNHIQLSGTGGVPHIDSSESVKIINNTVYASPRGISNDPYPMVQASTGHGVVLQSGGTDTYAEIINNLFMLHYNKSNMSGGGGANNWSGGGGVEGIVDYNRYFKTDLSDSFANYFDGTDDFVVHKATLSAGLFTGLGGTVEQHSAIVTTLPTEQADFTLNSGKWLDTDATPTTLGGGTEYDFKAYGIYVDSKGNRILTSRNIGAK